MGAVRELSERWWSLFTTGKVSEAAALMSEDVTMRAPGVEIRGRAEVGPYLQGFRDQFPDIRPTIVACVEQGDQAVIELRIDATHGATGTKVVWKAADHVRIAGGKIVAWHPYWDRVAFGAQLGGGK